MKKIAIVGAGGLGRQVKMIIDHINKVEPTYEIIGFYDDKIYDEEINGVKYLGAVSEINKVNYPLHVVISIANPSVRKKIVNSISNRNISFPILIHPSVIIGNDDVEIGKGSIISAGTIITVNIKVGDFVILNHGITVGHDVIIKDYCSVMPSVNISGEVVIEEGVYIGAGAKIINQLEIGKYTIVGAGAVVAKTLPGGCTAVGIPAKPIKFHNE